MKHKKTTIAIISVIALALVIIGVTYAYWIVTRTQQKQNTISTGCLDIDLTGEKNDITLEDAFPTSDEDGMKLTPYEFTITNKCDSAVDYQVALETIGDEDSTVIASAIKVALDDSISLLSDKSDIAPTYENAFAAKKLTMGTLAAYSEENEDDSVTYNLRLWIDADAPISEMNKTFESKITVSVGQGIVNPYKEGTIAYDIVSRYGGENSINYSQAKWVDKHEVDSEEVVGETPNEFVWGTSYEFDESLGIYKLTGEIVEAKASECANGIKEDGTVIKCGNYTTSYNCSKVGFHIYEVEEWIDYGVVLTKKFKEYNGIFDKITTEDEVNIYKAIDNYGESYYFRGNVPDNYIKFGSYAAGATVNGVTYEEETPMYWRIVRINGDGTIRLVYDGTEKVTNGTNHVATIESVNYNSAVDDVGFTYDDGTGKQIDSTIKSSLDKWYEDNLESKYSKYLADSIFCNDKELLEDEEISSVFNNARYTSTIRMDALNPTLICNQNTDKYTVSSSFGNGYLKYPIGLLSSDEILMLGAQDLQSDDGDVATSNYIDSGEKIWLMTPSRYYGITVFRGDTHPSNTDVQMASNGVRPVINLKADVSFTGDGSFETPYEIIIEQKIN